MVHSRINEVVAAIWGNRRSVYIMDGLHRSCIQDSIADVDRGRGAEETFWVSMGEMGREDRIQDGSSGLLNRIFDITFHTTGCKFLKNTIPSNRTRRRYLQE